VLFHILFIRGKAENINKETNNEENRKCVHSQEQNSMPQERSKGHWNQDDKRISTPLKE